MRDPITTGWEQRIGHRHPGRFERAVDIAGQFAPVLCEAPVAEIEEVETDVAKRIDTRHFNTGAETREPVPWRRDATPPWGAIAE